MMSTDIESGNDSVPTLQPLPPEGGDNGIPWLRTLGSDEVTPSEVTSEDTPNPDEDELKAAVPKWFTILRPQNSVTDPPPEPERQQRGGISAAPPSDKSGPSWTAKVFAGVAAATALVAVVTLTTTAVVRSDDPPAASSDSDSFRDDLNGARADVVSAAPAAPVAPVELDCVEGTTEGAVTGNGKGDTKSVAGVVLAFEYAYYVKRSADAAFAVTAKDSAFTDKDALQTGIDNVQKGTTYCVAIKETGKNVARVQVTEVRPSDEPEVFDMVITTTRTGDGTVALVSIEAAPQ